MKQYLSAQDANLQIGKGGGAIQEMARALLDSKMVDYVIAFVEGTGPQDLRVAFISNPEEAGQIIPATLNPYSMTRLLRDYGEGNAAVIGRTCDVRAVIELRKRNRLPGEVYTIGVTCSDLKSLPGVLKPNCQRCDERVPVMADVSCVLLDGVTVVEATTEKGAAILAAGSFVEHDATESEAQVLAAMETELEAARTQKVADFVFQQMPLSSRFEYWFSQFDKCIKCFGCRTSCPICYCKECVLEADRGVVPAGEMPASRMYHLTRLAHVGDSCINCGSCEAACPMQIPISKIYHMAQTELGQIFNYRPGYDDARMPLTMFAAAELGDGRTDIKGR